MASIAKRRWKKPDGSTGEVWVVRYRDRKGKQRQETFELKKQADAARRRIENELLDGTHVSARSSVRLEACCHDFLKLQEDRMDQGALTLGSYQNAKTAIDKHIIPRLGRLVMTDVTPLDVEDFYRALVREAKLAPKTARGRVSYLKSVFDFGVKRGYAARNPVVGALDDIGTVKVKPIRVFTREEMRRLLAVADDRKLRRFKRPWAITRLAVHLAAFCGLRYGEIFGLTLGNLDLESRVIHVRHSITPQGVLKGPKTHAGIRDVPLPAHIAELLKEWFTSGGFRRNDLDLVFCRKGGRPMDPASFHETYWRPLLKNAGMMGGERSFHFHALRHFAASNMIASGMPIIDTASLLGHQRFDMTLQVYAHPVVNGRQRAALFDAMAAAMMQPSTALLPSKIAHGVDMSI